jgi:hypothetical protein
MELTNMALDTYVVSESRDPDFFLVSRYKQMECLETHKVPLKGQVAFSTEKRRSIVNKWIEDGKPPGSIYWFENNEVRSTCLESLKVGDRVEYTGKAFSGVSSGSVNPGHTGDVVSKDKFASGIHYKVRWHHNDNESRHSEDELKKFTK